jgi:hypothetical protein
MSLDGIPVAEVTVETAAEAVQQNSPTLLTNYPQRRNSIKDSLSRVKAGLKMSQNEFEKYKNEPMPTRKVTPPY